MTAAESGPPDPVTAAARHGASDTGIVLIAVFDLIKALLFLVAAVGVFPLVNRDTHVELTQLLHVFRLNGDHEFVRNLLLKANVITNPDKRIFTGVLLLYTVLYAIEGIGLLLRKRWAEYFAVAMTAIPLPFEAYTLWHHTAHPPHIPLVSFDQRVAAFSDSRVFVLKIVVLLLNAGIVWFLVRHLRHAVKWSVAVDDQY